MDYQNNVLLWLMIFLFSSLSVATAQLNVGTSPVSFTLAEVAILDIEPDNIGIELKPQFNGEAGTAFDNFEAMDNTKWINYTSAIDPITTGSRTISAQITGGTLPTGIELSVTASSPIGGAGDTGQSMGKVSLNNTAQQIISNIGSSFTGDGSGSGHQLTYRLKLTDLENVSLLNSTLINIVYTITD